MLDKCLEYLTKALQSFQAEGDQAMEGDVYLALGELFVTKHELEHAKDSFRTAFDIYSKLEKKSEERNQAARSLEKVIQELKTEALRKKFQKMQHVIQVGLWILGDFEADWEDVAKQFAGLVFGGWNGIRK